MIHGPDIPTISDLGGLRGTPSYRGPFRGVAVALGARGPAADYESVRDGYLAAKRFRELTETRLLASAPGSERGRALYGLMRAAEVNESARRVDMLAHPDAPPQG